MTEVYAPSRIRLISERAANDFGMFAYDGFGIMLSDEQLEAHRQLGGSTPRTKQDPKVTWLSGGQRSGKTVFAALEHADACLYKRGLDNTDRRYWVNYQYGTLAIAPTEQLTLRLWTIMDEISKGTSDAQYDRKARHSRGGAFLGRLTAGKDKFGGIVHFSGGSHVDFRSSEGYAYRLEGGQWWFITWDEWASQPDREIPGVLSDVLYGRSRDHDAKIMPMAWPKRETEHNLLKVVRDIESGKELDHAIVYLDASHSPWTNKAALKVELRTKSKAQISRTIQGRPVGGAGIEFKDWMIERLFKSELPFPAPPEEGFAYLASWDLGLASDSSVGLVWRIPIVDGRRIVTPEFPVRIVNAVELKGSADLSLDTLALNIAREQAFYRALSAMDATSMGGIAAFRHLRDLRPAPLPFASRSNDRIWGNMRLAAITNGLDMLTWGRKEGLEDEIPWGMIEAPDIQMLRDQLATFDRDDAKIADDWVWAFLIGCWYIRRFWALGDPGDVAQRTFDVRRVSTAPLSGVTLTRRKRGRLITVDQPMGPAVAPSGVRYIKPQR